MTYRADVIEALDAAGCYLLEELNDQQEIWFSPKTGRRFIVEKTIKSKVTRDRILKEAGIL